jgi:hypothetical protein
MGVGLMPSADRINSWIPWHPAYPADPVGLEHRYRLPEGVPVGIPTLFILLLAEMCSASDKQLVSDCRDDKGLLSRRYVTLRGRGTGAQANYELTRGTRRGRFAHYYERC